MLNDIYKMAAIEYQNTEHQNTELSSIFTLLPIDIVNVILTFTSDKLRKKACIINNIVNITDYYYGLYLLNTNIIPHISTPNLYQIANYFSLVTINHVAYVITYDKYILTFRNFITGKILYRYYFNFNDADAELSS